MLHGIAPNDKFLRVFGCLCFPYIHPYTSHKLEFCSHPGIFLGYSSNYHGYRCLDPVTGNISVAQTVVFDELSFPFSSRHSPYTVCQHPFTSDLSAPSNSVPDSKHSSPFTLPIPKPISSSSHVAQLETCPSPVVNPTTNENTFVSQDNDPPLSSTSVGVSSQRTHSMFTRLHDGTPAPHCFLQSRHSIALSMTMNIKELRSFFLAQIDPSGMQ